MKKSLMMVCVHHGMNERTPADGLKTSVLDVCLLTLYPWYHLWLCLKRCLQPCILYNQGTNCVNYTFCFQWGFFNAINVKTGYLHVISDIFHAFYKRKIKNVNYFFKIWSKKIIKPYWMDFPLLFSSCSQRLSKAVKNWSGSNSTIT